MMSALSMNEASRCSRVTLPVRTVGGEPRERLVAWRSEIENILQSCKGLHIQPRAHRRLSSALAAAYEALADVCAEARGEIIEEAVSAVQRYFPKKGDARVAVLSFPAIVDLNFFLLGPEPDDSLLGIARQAKETIETIDRVLEEKEIWEYEGAGLEMKAISLAPNLSRAVQYVMDRLEGPARAEAANAMLGEVGKLFSPGSAGREAATASGEITPGQKEVLRIVSTMPDDLRAELEAELGLAQ